MKLLDYIRGSRKGKEAHRIERDAMSDPLLSDALEGFDRVKEENHALRIENLQKRMAARMQEQHTQEQKLQHTQQPKLQDTRQPKHYLRNWCAVACLFAALFAGGYYLLLPEMEPYDRALTNVEFYIDSLPAMPAAPVASKRTLSKVPDAPESETKRTSAPQAIAPSAPRAQAISTPPSEVASDTSEQVVTVKYIPIKVVKEKAVKEKESVKEKDALKKPLLGASITDRIMADAKLRGKVTDANGTPLVGATIRAIGTQHGTVTNLDGLFYLPTKPKKLEVSYIGYNTVVVPPDTSQVMLIAMNEDDQALSEVVVVGYGTQKKADYVGSIAPTPPAKQPQPLIGLKAYKRYLKENLRRPTEGECQGVKGKVIIRFHVDSQGKPQELFVKKSLCPAADEEAMRLINEGSGWTAGNEIVTVTVKF